MAVGAPVLRRLRHGTFHVARRGRHQYLPCLGMTRLIGWECEREDGFVVDALVMEGSAQPSRRRANHSGASYRWSHPGSCTESIDETPSGMLLHGIMSSIAEFYSRNLANEVIKGSVQKAKAGGTVGKTPIGYLNVRRTENGSENRTVEIDPVNRTGIVGGF